MPYPPNLSPGIHQMNEQEFITAYCKSELRENFIEPVEYIFKFAKQTSAKSIFIGGSFLTSKPDPTDIDFLIVYGMDNQIPSQSEMLALHDVRLDVMFCSYQDRSIVESYLHLFGHDRQGKGRGVVQIKVDSSEDAFVLPESYDEKKLDLIKNTYVGRQMIQRNAHRGILISIHGLLSRAEWNFDIAPIASSNGWIFAPYVYSAPWNLLISRRKRKKTIDSFRNWVYDISERYKTQTANVSVVAHSYGTFLLGKYLIGFDKLPININSIILTGSILDCGYNWNNHFDEMKVGRVLNIYSPNDNWVAKMLKGKLKKFLGMDMMFGQAGLSGFNTKHQFLLQRKLDILDHNNSIRRDVIETIWMPFLNNNNNSLAVNKFNSGVKANVNQSATNSGVS